ncbi:MAG: hypothetical protein KGI06_00245 [Candidatus Micrarchaeota archaeon]|nr:hypothetical protein [Candidatus Micrarchaeota archaeon]
MVCFVYSKDVTSSNIASSLKAELGLEEAESFHGMRSFVADRIRMIEISDALVHAESLDGILDDTAIFLSRHSSSMGIASFTVHAEGNWSSENPLGGRPKSLSVSSPVGMIKVLGAIGRMNISGMGTTYEATHHGPYLDNPSFFVELGGNEDMMKSVAHAKLIASAIAVSLDEEPEYDKIAVGIGGMHYPEKFTRLALEGKYAFSHIMPKYHIACIDMLGSAFERSDIGAEIAVIEWKSIKAVGREMIVRELNRLGIDYAKV